MNGFFEDIIPVILLFVFGYLLKRLAVVKREDGDLLLKIVFYFSLPALILKALPMTELTPQFALLPLIATSIMMILFLVAKVAASLLRLPSGKAGVFVVGSMILNIGFTLPFVMAAYGSEGLSRIMIFDLGNGIVVFSFVYYQACRYGSGSSGESCPVFYRFLKSPPLWAIAVGLVMNATGVRPTGFSQNFLVLAGDLTIPLLMLSIGIFFEPRFSGWRELSALVFVRMGLGLLLGFAFVSLAGLEGLTRNVVLLGSATPVGYNTLTFSSIEKLDGAFAANAVSVSILAGIIWYPVLIFFIL